MSKKKNKLNLIQKAQNKFKKFKGMDLNYRTILSEALALIYEIYQRTSDEKFEEELKNECEKAGLNYQINNLNKAIYRYGGSVNDKARSYRYISGIKKLGIMQPRTLKVVGDIITAHLSSEVKTNKEDKYCMFTLVMGFNFGKDMRWKRCK